MKRDLDLIRHILLEIEAHPGAEGLSSDGFQVEGVPAETVIYNLKLAHQAGLIEGLDLSDFENFNLLNINLTWEGHEFLDKIKNETVWRQAKSKVKETAEGMSFEILKCALTEIIKKQLSI